MSSQNLISRVGFWSGVWAGVAAVAFPASLVVLVLAGIKQPAWTGDLAAFASGFEPPMLVVPVTASLLIVPGFLGVCVAAHYSAPEQLRVLTHLGVLLAAVYAATVGINYFLQLATVRNSLAAAEFEGLGLLLMENPRSAFSALEGLGYGWQGLALLLVTFAFGSDRAGRWIRGLALVVLLASAIGVTGVLLGFEVTHPLMLTSGVLWLLCFPVAMVLTGVATGRTAEFPAPPRSRSHSL